MAHRDRQEFANTYRGAHKVDFTDTYGGRTRLDGVHTHIQRAHKDRWGGGTDTAEAQR